jgi:hypothetical protein
MDQKAYRQSCLLPHLTMVNNKRCRGICGGRCACRACREYALGFVTGLGITDFPRTASQGVQQRRGGVRGDERCAPRAASLLPSDLSDRDEGGAWGSTERAGGRNWTSAPSFISGGPVLWASYDRYTHRFISLPLVQSELRGSRLL